MITKAEESQGPPAVSKPEARTMQSESRAQSLRSCWGKALFESENRDPRHRGPRAGEGRRLGVSRERDFVLSPPFCSLQALPGQTSSVHSQADRSHTEQISGRPVPVRATHGITHHTTPGGRREGHSPGPGLATASAVTERHSRPNAKAGGLFLETLVTVTDLAFVLKVVGGPEVL